MLSLEENKDIFKIETKAISISKFNFAIIENADIFDIAIERHWSEEEEFITLLMMVA